MKKYLWKREVNAGHISSHFQTDSERATVTVSFCDDETKGECYSEMEYKAVLQKKKKKA